MSKTKEERKPLNAWKCLSCQPDYPEFDSPAEFKAHLLSVHKIEETKGKKTALFFMDGARGWFEQAWEWWIGPEGNRVKAHQIVQGKKGSQ